MMDLLDQVLMSLRRITRASSIQSRKLVRSSGVTSTQLMVLRALRDLGDVTASEIARDVSLSQATLTLVISSLESRELIHRARSRADRRRMHISLTDRGRSILDSAPRPLQENFARRFETLEKWEQHQLVSALEHIAAMMDAEDLDAAPLLTHDAELAEDPHPPQERSRTPRDTH